ncbi:hypothetical protein DDB_G0269494 [Dictyostelium discoideum AX4]|uniref:Uncharacterized protein n=1 Tax=Dictyostelium discoideum TaxID=44689 RepID=Q55DX0_DICDI|nr:hypothetical protein DDB_G0269494 [Dictyostelium discoideum AX4]EAL72097.1 hypothetical protein DDB_G0269494 [Dictyostelium discoideum AX4]|eukprot:XP_646011.1 hypothetical protein DDB_G0269494 [Dictyostelium discoideum AX4]
MGNQFTNKKIVPKYLENEILKKILDYLLIKNKKKQSFYDIKRHYSKKRFFRYNKEIIDYSLVSKKWFQFISNIIENNIIENDILNKWIFCRNKQFNINKISHELKDTLRNFTLSINNVNSIINIENQLITNYFNERVLIIHANDHGDNYNKSIEMIKEINENSSIFNYEKIIIDNIKGYESTSSESDLILNTISKLINNINNNNQNYQDKLIIDIEWLTSRKWDEIHRDQFGLSNEMFKINKLTIREYNGNYSSRFPVIQSLKPKKIEIKEYYDDYDERPSYNYSPLFSTDNDRLESIIIKEGWVNVGNLKNINYHLPNLHTLSISLLIHDIIKSILINDENFKKDEETLRDCNYYFIGNREIESEQNDSSHWESMINSLSNCKNLKKLSIDSFCMKMNDECFKISPNHQLIYSISENVILNGLKRILESDDNQIQYFDIGFDLNLNGYPDYSINFFKSLESNFKLKTLSFKKYQLPNSILNYLFSNLFKINNSINHLIIELLPPKFDDHQLNYNLIFKFLFLNFNSYNSLYSITLKIYDISIFNNILIYFKEFQKEFKKNYKNYKQSSLKEFNIYLFFKEPQDIENYFKKLKKIKKIFIINLIKS